MECQEGRHRPLILSEVGQEASLPLPLIEYMSQFTGTYSYSGFRSCIPINPWDKRATAEAIHQVSPLTLKHSTFSDGANTCRP